MLLSAAKPPPRVASYALEHLGAEELVDSGISSLPIYGANLRDLAAGAGVRAFRPVGWRWFVRGDEHWSALDVYFEGGRRPAGDPQRQSGRMIDEMVTYLTSASDDEAEFVDARLIQLPDLHFSSLWLTSSQSPDLVYTFSPIATFKAHTRLDADQLQSALSARARRQVDVIAQMKGEPKGDPQFKTAVGSAEVGWESDFQPQGKSETRTLRLRAEGLVRRARDEDLLTSLLKRLQKANPIVVSAIQQAVESLVSADDALSRRQRMKKAKGRHKAPAAVTRTKKSSSAPTTARTSGIKKSAALKAGARSGTTTSAGKRVTARRKATSTARGTAISSDNSTPTASKALGLRPNKQASVKDAPVQAKGGADA